MFTNKHVIAALLVTPILAVLAYFAVDNVVSEKPHSAVEGGTYKLIAKPNCRYGSGVCTFKNGEMEMDITLTQQGQFVLVSLTSLVPLSAVKMSLTEATVSEPVPIDLVSVQGEPNKWRGRFKQVYSGDELLRMVVKAGGAFYFGDTVAAFAYRDDPYGNDGHDSHDERYDDHSDHRYDHRYDQTDTLDGSSTVVSD